MAELVVSMEQRMAVAFAACADGTGNVTAFCAEHGISRQTFYVYRRRFRGRGLAGAVTAVAAAGAFAVDDDGGGG